MSVFYFYSFTRDNFVLARNFDNFLAQLNVKLGTAGTSPISINSAGNVGINNEAPFYKLDVVGDLNITGVYRINGVPIAGGTEFYNTAGTYLGNGQSDRLINLGFRPNYVRIIGYNPNSSKTFFKFEKWDGMPANKSFFQIEIGKDELVIGQTFLNINDNGFRVGGSGNSSTNQSSVVYYYIAIR